MVNVGLVLSGGGARAAYQVGALRALQEISSEKALPFNILAGLSAGAINAVSLATGADDFKEAVALLSETWLSLTPDAVYRTDVSSLTTLGMRWIKDLTLGGLVGRSPTNYLLDTAPLRELLGARMDTSRIQRHIESGALRGVAVSATNYLTGTIVSFFDAPPEVQPWIRYDRVAFRDRITLSHVMASAAIPIFFPPVSINGCMYGDGGVRMTTPVSPAIHLGAEKIVAIGIRYARSSEQTLKLNREARAENVSVAQIGGVLLNALFLDSLDNDLERLQRINRTLGFVSAAARKQHPDSLRRIPALSLRPSQDLGRLVGDEARKFPTMLRYLLKSAGAQGNSGLDMMSYLAFQPGYVQRLMDLGYQDTKAREREVVEFFEAPVDGASAEQASA
ncbi:MAG: patatin-like phospholipase family protein [Myxococcales bacterium]